MSSRPGLLSYQSTIKERRTYYCVANVVIPECRFSVLMAWQVKSQYLTSWHFNCTTSVVLTLFEEQLSYNDFFLIVSTIYYTYYIYSLHPTTGHTEVEVCETVSPGPGLSGIKLAPWGWCHWFSASWPGDNVVVVVLIVWSISEYLAHNCSNCNTRHPFPRHTQAREALPNK